MSLIGDTVFAVLGVVKMSGKPIVLLDFDGTIHQYTTPWADETVIPDCAVDGFFDWANVAKDSFRLVVYSARSKTPEGREAMQRWMASELCFWEIVSGNDPVPLAEALEFANEKPKAFFSIDDRAFQFNGDWSDPNLDPESILAFKPWNKRN